MNREYLIENITTNLEELGQDAHWINHYQEENDQLQLIELACQLEDKIKNLAKSLKALRKSFK
jgi:hypothetical protein